MVKKLYKHEMLYYLRSLLPVYIVLFGVAAVGRFIGFFESEKVAYEVLRGSSVSMLVVAILATIALSFVFSIVRFYKNMFTGEGYLTLTLPVTPNSHLLVKVTSAVLANVASVIASILAVCLFTVGEWLVELGKAASYLIDTLAEVLEGHLVFYILEMIPVMLMSVTCSILLYYMCISLGQLFRKNRILAAVGVYFGLYICTQILSTVLTIVLSLSSFLWVEEFFANFTKQDWLVAFHVILGIGFVWNAIVALVYFLISRFVLTRKLNLE